METPNNVPQTGNEPQGDAAPQVTNNDAIVSATATPAPGLTPVQPSLEALQAQLAEERKKAQGLEEMGVAERRKRQELEQAFYAQQAAVTQLMQQRTAAPPVQPAEVDYLDGLAPNDLFDPEKLRQGVNRAIRRVRDEAVATANQSVEQVRFQMRYPDFEVLVGSNDPITGSFRTSEILTEALTEDPDLHRELAQATTAAEKARLAYRAAKNQKRLREARLSNQTTAQQQAASQRAQAAANQHAANTVAAVTQPMSPAAVGGPPAQTSHLDLNTLLRNPNALDDIVRGIEQGKYG